MNGAALLSGDGIALKPFREEDATDRYVGWLNDPMVNRYLDVRFTPQTRVTGLAFVRSFQSEVEKYMWGIWPDGEDHPVGTATLYHINRTHGGAELGLLIGEKDLWGGRTASVVIGLIARHAFGPLGLRRLTGGTYAPHHAMNFLYRKLGFRLEGRLVKAHRLGEEYVDGYRWAILAEEWAARHGV